MTERRSVGKLRLDRPAAHVARLTIDNPAKRNALDHEILDALASTVAGLDDARCLLLTARARCSAPATTSATSRPSAFAERAEALVAHPFQAALEALDAFPFPAVAALNGHAIGGGLELALACDLRVAAAGARLGMPPARLGLVYSHTGLRKFVDAIGAPRTRELFFTARSVTPRSPPSAGAWSTRWSAGDELAERARRARRRDRRARAALPARQQARAARAAGRGGGARPARRARARARCARTCFRSEDFAEGVRAFAEKRPPRWHGPLRTVRPRRRSVRGAATRLPGHVAQEGARCWISTTAWTSSRSSASTSACGWCRGPQGPRVVLDGRPVLLLCSGNALGLADHPRVRQAAADAAMRWGVGAGAARVASGTMTLHRRLEERLADVLRQARRRCCSARARSRTWA